MTPPEGEAVDRNSLIASAQKYIQKGQLDRAIEVYRKLVAGDPSDVRLLLKMADLQERSGKRDDAAQTFREAAAHFIEKGFLFKALAVYKQLHRLTPDDLDVRMTLADLHADVSLTNDARRLYASLSREFERAGRTGDAIDTLRKLIDIESGDASLHIRLAELHARSGSTDAAADAMIAAGRELLRNRRYSEYGRVAERILAWREEHAETLRGLAEALIALGEPRRAIGRAQKAYRLDPEDVEALGLLARGLDAMGESARAEKLLADVEAKYRNDGRDDLAEAVVALRSSLDEPDGPARTETPIAVAALQAQAAARDPVDEAQRLLDEVAVYRKYGLHDKAIAHVDRVLGMIPMHPPALTLRAELLDEAGDAAGAAEARALLEGATSSGDPTPRDGVDVVVDDLDDLMPLDDDELEDGAFFGGGDDALDDETFVVDEDDGPLTNAEPARPGGSDTFAELPDPLREALSHVADRMDAGDEDQARAGLLDLLGDWPAHAEPILQAMDRLTELRDLLGGQTTADEPAPLLEDVEFEPLPEDDASLKELATHDVEFTDDDADLADVDFVDADDEEDVAFLTGDVEFVDDDVDAGDVEFVDDDADLADVDFVDADDDADVAFLTGDVEFVDDDADDVELADAEFEPLDEDATEVAGLAGDPDDGPLDTPHDEDAVDAVDAPEGRPGAAVTLVFTPSATVLFDQGESELAEAIQQRMAGNGLMVMSVLEEEIFGANTVAASYELAMAQMQMGLYLDAAMGMEGLLRVPDLSEDDVALLHYVRGICFEALAQVDSAREAFGSIAPEQERHFPDLATRVRRLAD
ncbi:MAG: hypothetical protein EA398_08150 [Deltaproteobacteria bacterium]|nr:MAG: hypothetical protein EA398_08150 [Deltaproteobacteria bacterium]